MTKPGIARRALLQALAVSPLLAASNWPRAAFAATAGLSFSELDERLVLITGAGGNVLLYKGAEGLTLVDSGHAENITALLSLVDELGVQKPVTTLINTHWHEDHTGGNEALQARGAAIIAHENTRLWLTADFEVEWRGQVHKPRPREALPTRTFHVAETLQIDGAAVELEHYWQAHTDGDITVYFPDHNVLVAGGLLSNYRYPIADIATGGWIGGLLEANKTMLTKVNASTVIIPDRGPALGKGDLQAQHDMLADLYEKMKKLAQEGFSGRDMLQENLTADYDERWGDPEQFLLESYRGMWAHTYDMGGFI